MASEAPVQQIVFDFIAKQPGRELVHTPKRKINTQIAKGTKLTSTQVASAVHNLVRKGTIRRKGNTGFTERLWIPGRAKPKMGPVKRTPSKAGRPKPATPTPSPTLTLELGALIGQLTDCETEISQLLAERDLVENQLVAAQIRHTELSSQIRQALGNTQIILQIKEIRGS